MSRDIRPRRDLGRWYRPVVSLTEEGQISDLPRSAVVTRPVGDGYLDAVVEQRDADITFVGFSAALAVPEWTVPYFVGATLPGDVAANVVMLSDPGLERPGAPRLAWYAGTESIPEEAIAAFLRTVVAAAGGTRVVLFGASGGGFAALNYAKYFPGSAVIAVNPQTNILRYSPSAWMNYGRKCLGVDSPDQIAEAIRTRTTHDLCPVYSAGVDTAVLYLQNATDDLHVTEHLNPFRRALASAHPFRLVMGDWGEGHKAPPKEQIAETVQAVLRESGPLARVIERVRVEA